MQFFTAATCGLLGRVDEARSSFDRLENLLGSLDQSRASEILTIALPFQPELVDSVLKGLDVAGMAFSTESAASIIIEE